LSIKTFSLKINITYHHWRYVLLGKRNLSYSKAKVAAPLLKTSVEVWMDPSLVADRQAAWAIYQEKEKTK